MKATRNELILLGMVWFSSIFGMWAIHRAYKRGEEALKQQNEEWANVYAKRCHEYHVELAKANGETEYRGVEVE